MSNIRKGIIAFIGTLSILLSAFVFFKLPSSLINGILGSALGGLGVGSLVNSLVDSNE